MTLPAIASVNPGWTMGFATDNGKGMTVTAPSGAILSGGKAVSSIILGPGNYENVALQSDGNNWRVISSTRNTRLVNGFDPPPWPSNWLYPSTLGLRRDIGGQRQHPVELQYNGGIDGDPAGDDSAADGLEHGFCDRQHKALVGAGQCHIGR